MAKQTPPSEVVNASKESKLPVDYLHGVWRAAIKSNLDPAETMAAVIELAEPCATMD